MSSSTIRGGVDTYVMRERPNKTFGRMPFLRLKEGDMEGYIRIKSPAPRGATIISATLVYTQILDEPGSRTLNIQRTAGDANQAEVWSTKPAGTGPVSSVTSGRPTPAGYRWRFDVAQQLQDIANGAVNRGFKITCNAGTEVRVHGFNATKNLPFLEVVWGAQVGQPSNLSPGGSGAISLAKWRQTCDYIDRNGTSDINAVQVQIDPGGDWAGADLWDSGAVSTVTPSLDLEQTTYPGLAAGATTKLRMRVRDDAGRWSGWSDTVTITRQPKSVLTITAPGAAPNDKVFEFTPPISWSFTGQQTSRRVTVSPANDPKRIIHDTGRDLAGPSATTYVLPAGVLRDDQAYIVRVYVWDQIVRETAAGDPPYVMAAATFTVDYDPNQIAPTGVTASSGDSPWCDLTITRGSAPSSWTIQRSEQGADGWRTVAADITPADVAVNGTTWRIRDWTVRPGLAYQYRVRAEVNGYLSSFVTANYRCKAAGIWLLDPARPTAPQVQLGERNITGSAEDQAVSFSVLGSPDVVRTSMGLTGLIGQCEALLIRDRPTTTWQQIDQRIQNIKSRQAEEFRLVMGDLNIPVVLGDIVTMPHPQTTPDQVLKQASFRFWQTGEHAYLAVSSAGSGTATTNIDGGSASNAFQGQYDGGAP